MLTTAYAFQTVCHTSGLEPLMGNAEDVIGWFCRHRKGEFAGCPFKSLSPYITSIRPLGLHLLQHGTVRAEQFHRAANKIFVGTDVLHLALQPQCLYLLPLVILHADVPSAHLYLDGQVAADEFHGIGHGKAVRLGRNTQVGKALREDVYAIFRLFATDGLQGFEQRCVAKGTGRLCHRNERQTHQKGLQCKKSLHHGSSSSSLVCETMMVSPSRLTLMPSKAFRRSMKSASWVPGRQVMISILRRNFLSRKMTVLP